MDTNKEVLTTRLRRIQSTLGVDADGLLGPETLTALERKLGIDVPARTVSLECSKSGVDLLVAFEIGSRRLYEKKYQRPIWPGGQSGVTVGVGYDLGMTSKAEIRADWEPLLGEADLVALLAVQGVTGPAAKRLAQGISQVVIPLELAERVFYTRTAPLYAARTRAAFPGVQKLPPDAQAMMLSLVYNRGASVLGPKRREMANLQTLLRGAKPVLEHIAREFESMQRLWPGTELAGLRTRRQREANVVRAAARQYEPAEIVRL
jgi:hypothetical protein